MKAKEAIIRIKDHNNAHQRKERFAVKITEALGLAVLALEKQVPRPLDYESNAYDEKGQLIYDVAKCQVCGREFEENINDWGCKYCANCGQCLDWSEID